MGLFEFALEKVFSMEMTRTEIMLLELRSIWFSKWKTVKKGDYF